jgi:hypothetical protein
LSIIERKARQGALSLCPPGVTSLDPATILILVNVVIAALRLYQACRDMNQVQRPSLWNRIRMRQVVYRACRARGVSDWYPVYEAALKVGRTSSREEVDEALLELARLDATGPGGVSETDP